MHKKVQGNYGESLVISQILENECAAFTDFGDNSKVDIVVEDTKGQLHKVQVKCYSREKSKPNSTAIYVTKSGPNYSFKYTKEDFDWFAVVDMKTKKIAWISNDVLTKYNSCFTLSHTRRQKGQNMFDDYLKFPFGLEAKVGEAGNF